MSGLPWEGALLTAENIYTEIPGFSVPHLTAADTTNVPLPNGVETVLAHPSTAATGGFVNISDVRNLLGVVFIFATVEVQEGAASTGISLWIRRVNPQQSAFQGPVISSNPTLTPSVNSIRTHTLFGFDLISEWPPDTQESYVFSAKYTGDANGVALRGGAAVIWC